MASKKVLKTLHIVVPVLMIFALAYITFVYYSDIETGAWAFGSLVIYYPIIFLLQGIACSLLRVNVFVSLGISIAAYIIVLFVWMNSSAIVYIFAYLIIGFIGYGITRFIQKARKPKVVT